MSPPRALVQLMRADYLERVRRHGFLVALACTVYFAYLSMPARHARYVTLQIGMYRGLYDSNWVGCQVALMTAAFLSLVGFYLVKNTIERDRATGVGAILAASPLSRWQYTVGKWASNLAVLATMVATVAICAIGMQLLRGEDLAVRPWAIAVPFVLITLPALAMTAGFAVLFEAFRPLRGGLGNAAYFFVWSLVFTAPDMASPKEYHGIGSAVGISTVVPVMIQSVATRSGIPRDSLSFSLGFNFKEHGTRELHTFRWPGMQWSGDRLLGRLVWALLGLGLAFGAAVPFDRFDSSPTRAGPRARRARSPAAAEAARDSVGALASAPPSVASAGALVAPMRGGGFLTLVGAELKLALRAMPRPWFVLAAALSVACAFTPMWLARGWLLPFAWIWPLTVWSSLGARERQHGTEALVFSAPHGLARQLPAMWLAGVLVAVVMGAGVAFRLLAAGDLPGAGTWAVGALFIPSLALAAGVWTGSGKLFEVLYLLLWYAGPMQHVPFLDFTGESRTAPWFAGAALVLLASATLGRRNASRR